MRTVARIPSPLAALGPLEVTHARPPGPVAPHHGPAATARVRRRVRPRHDDRGPGVRPRHLRADHVRRARHAHAPRLRAPGGGPARLEERDQHLHEELRELRGRRHRVLGGRVRADVRCAALPERVHQGHLPGRGRLLLPDGLRRHRRDDRVRCDRRPHEVRRLPRLRLPRDRLRLPDPRPVALGRRLARPDGLRATSPGRRWCTPSAASRRSPGCSRSVRASGATSVRAWPRCLATTCRSPASASSCSGSAGSASTAVRSSCSARSPTRRRSRSWS